MSVRVLVAALSHESNGLVDGVTRLEDFTVRRGDAVLSCIGDASTLAGALEAIADFGWTAVPAIAMHAWPSAPAEDAVVSGFLDEMRAAVARAGRVDGVVLVMHGAMQSASCSDVEGQVLGELRRLPALAEVPMVVALDLHGNVTDAMAAGVDAIVAYRRNPHDDLRATGMRAVAVLKRLVTGRQRGRCVRATAGAPLAPAASATEDEPMRGLEVAARAVEQSDHSVLEAAIFAGFPYVAGGEVEMSCCVSVVGDRSAARAHADRLAAAAKAHRPNPVRVEVPPGEIVARIRCSPTGTVVVAEPADNIGGGARGDGTGLLRALIDADVGGSVLLAITDPTAVESLAGVALGGRKRIGIGGRSFHGDAGPLEREWTLRSRSDGIFRLEDPLSPLAAFHGQTVRMGPCVVVEYGAVRVLITSKPTAPWDRGQWHSQGLDPQQARVIGVKSAAAHRRAYQAIASAWLSVDTPGPCPSVVPQR